MMGAMSETQRLNAAVASVRRRASLKPKIAIVLGSGLGEYASHVVDPTVVPYSEIDGMPMSGVAGHAGNFVLGTLEGVSAILMQGRVHLYEGHRAADVVFGVRLMLALGAQTLIVTNAAGGACKALEVGDLMVIDDHINLTGHNPLVGPHEPELGERFIDMTIPYDLELRELAIEGARALGIELKRGVYAGLLGPSYETTAEIAMIRSIGAEAVGMSTVLEVIAARQMNARVLGLSLITNLAAGLGDHPLSHDEVQATAERSRQRFASLIGAVLRRLA